MENKKTLILSIVGILVLVVAVVGISFAMYTFTGTGSQTNVIQTGSITLNVAKESGNSFTFDGSYPMTDAKGVSLTENKAEVAVSATWNTTAPVTIKYDLGVEVVSEGAKIIDLTEDYVKIALVDSTGKVVVGTEAGEQNLTGGVTIGSLKETAGPNNLITAYGLTGGTLSTSGTIDKYTVYAWVADNYELPVDAANSTTDNDGSLPITDGSATAEPLHKKQTANEVFKFKLVVSAKQI